MKLSNFPLFISLSLISYMTQLVWGYESYKDLFPKMQVHFFNVTFLAV